MANVEVEDVEVLKSLRNFGYNARRKLNPPPSANRRVKLNTKKDGQKGNARTAREANRRQTISHPRKPVMAQKR